MAVLSYVKAKQINYMFPMSLLVLHQKIYLACPVFPLKTISTP